MSLSSWWKRHRWLVSGRRVVGGPGGSLGALREEYGSGAGLGSLDESYVGEGETLLHPVGRVPAEAEK